MNLVIFQKSWKVIFSRSSWKKMRRRQFFSFSTSEWNSIPLKKANSHLDSREWKRREREWVKAESERERELEMIHARGAKTRKVAKRGTSKSGHRRRRDDLERERERARENERGFPQQRALDAVFRSSRSDDTFFSFYMRPRTSIRGSVRPSTCPYVRYL